jgi:hypothetical protein
MKLAVCFLSQNNVPDFGACCVEVGSEARPPVMTKIRSDKFGGFGQIPTWNLAKQPSARLKTVQAGNRIFRKGPRRKAEL